MEHHGPESWLQQLPFLPHDPKYLAVNGGVLVFLFLTVFAILANLALRRAKDKALVPQPRFTMLSLADAVVDGLANMICGTLGPRGVEYVPFIGTLFLFVLLGNFLGLLPHSSAATSDVNTTFSLGFAAFVYYNWQGIKEHGPVGYAKHFLMGLGPLGVLIAMIELVSHAIRPLSLGVRLFVNMFVDHTVVLSFQSLFAWVLPVPLLLFGIVVSSIQAFVFATLTAMYVQMATEHEH